MFLICLLLAYCYITLMITFHNNTVDCIIGFTSLADKVGSFVPSFLSFLFPYVIWKNVKCYYYYSKNSQRNPFKSIYIVNMSVVYRRVSYTKGMLQITTIGLAHNREKILKLCNTLCKLNQSH